MFRALDPNPKQSKEAMDIVQTIEAWEIQSLERGQYLIEQLIELGVNEDMSKRAYKDIVRCFAMMAPFFPDNPSTSVAGIFENKNSGFKFRDSLLLR